MKAIDIDYHTVNGEGSETQILVGITHLDPTLIRKHPGIEL